MKKTVFSLILLLSVFSALAGKDSKEPAAEKDSSYTEEDFFIDYTLKQKASQDRLVLLNKKGNMAKLGEEKIEGLISGSLHYKTTVKGLKGIVTLTYSNYSDEEGWIFDGQIITKANMSADGTLDGCVSVKDIGKVYYEKVILKDGKAGGGSYGIELEGGQKKEVDYKLYFTACPE